jgi:bis(5'-nucleosyl)-tetraphosphatase (symmetrical)
MSTYCVGDIQGCLDQLYRLLQSAKFKPGRDRLLVAGDLVNRGPDSLATLRFIHSLKGSAQIVLGNHDLHLLACWHGHRDPARKDTFEEVLDAPDCAKLMNWLQSQPLLHFEKKYKALIVHAGIPPIWNLQQALEYAAEVQAVLKDERADSFFAAMYGNSPDRWSGSLKGPDRWRVITNYLTRMRFCSSKGKLDLNAKEGPGEAPDGYSPWFDLPNTGLKRHKVYFGHWAALMGETNSKQFIGLDTGCVWGGQLSMVRLDDGERFCEDCSI